MSDETKQSTIAFNAPKELNELATPGSPVDLMELVRLQKSQPEAPPSAESVVEAIPELSVEEQARKQGWRPKEEYSGNPNDWIDAKEFVGRGSFIREIDKLKRIINTMSSSISKAEERAYKKAVDELSVQKQQARLVGDIDTFEKVLKQEQEMAEQFKTEAFQTEEPPKQVNDIQAIMQSDSWRKFELENPWVKGTDDLSHEIRGYAQSVGVLYEQKHPNATPDEALAFVHKQVRTRFPELAPPERASLVSTSSVRTDSQSEKTFSNLSQGQREMLEYLKRNKSPFLKSYMENLKQEVSSNTIEIDTSKFRKR